MSHNTYATLGSRVTVGTEFVDFVRHLCSNGLVPIARSTVAAWRSKQEAGSPITIRCGIIAVVSSRLGVVPSDLPGISPAAAASAGNLIQRHQMVIDTVQEGPELLADWVARRRPEESTPVSTSRESMLRRRRPVLAVLTAIVALVFVGWAVLEMDTAFHDAVAKRTSRDGLDAIKLRIRDEVEHQRKLGLDPPFALSPVLIAELKSAARAMEYYPYPGDDRGNDRVSPERAGLLLYLDDLQIELAPILRDGWFGRAYFEDPNMEGRPFDRAQLIQARLVGLNCTAISLRGALLFGARFEMSTLADGTLENADLQKACFRGADLARVCFDGADVRGTLFDGADLRGARFVGTVFGVCAVDPEEPVPTSLVNADLRGCDLSRTVGLTDSMIEGAVLDESTVLPAGL